MSQQQCRRIRKKSLCIYHENSVCIIYCRHESILIAKCPLPKVFNKTAIKHAKLLLWDSTWLGSGRNFQLGTVFRLSPSWSGSNVSWGQLHQSTNSWAIVCCRSVGGHGSSSSSLPWDLQANLRESRGRHSLSFWSSAFAGVEWVRWGEKRRGDNTNHPTTRDMAKMRNRNISNWTSRDGAAPASGGHVVLSWWWALEHRAAEADNFEQPMLISYSRAVCPGKVREREREREGQTRRVKSVVTRSLLLLIN